MKILKRRRDGVVQKYNVKPKQKQFKAKPVTTNMLIRQKMNDPKIHFWDFYNFLQEKDIGNWDDVNSEEIITQYVTEKMKEGIHVSHILKAIEENPSRYQTYRIWLGNSMETPTPINTKKDLVEALDIDLKR